MSHWDRLDEDVFEEIEVTIDGKTQKIMKTDINIKFEGTFTEFIEWMAETFKDPASLYLRVGVGSKEAIVNVPGGQTFPVDEVTERVARAAGKSLFQMSEVERERFGTLVTTIRRLGRERKIEAIKEIRQLTGLGLKEAKELVESHGFIL